MRSSNISLTVVVCVVIAVVLFASTTDAAPAKKNKHIGSNNNNNNKNVPAKFDKNKNAVLTPTEIAALSNKQLRRMLFHFNDPCDGCVERKHLVDHAIDAYYKNVASYTTQLTSMQDSVKTNMAPFHVDVMAEVKDMLLAIDNATISNNNNRRGRDDGDVVVPVLDIPDFHFDPSVECSSPFMNETVYCQKVGVEY
eukprot:PhM_4_TR16421/c0_g1_i1/m.36408